MVHFQSKLNAKTLRTTPSGGGIGLTSTVTLNFAKTQTAFLVPFPPKIGDIDMNGLYTLFILDCTILKIFCTFSPQPLFKKVHWAGGKVVTSLFKVQKFDFFLLRARSYFVLFCTTT